MGNALSARLAAIQSEAERLQALQASAERKAREGLLLQRTSDAEHLQQRQEYFIDMISHEVRVRPSDERHRVELKTALRD
jgi:predicted transcriptional regulator of viral defense system